MRIDLGSNRFTICPSPVRDGDIDAKLAKLWKAQAAVETLLFGENAAPAIRLVKSKNPDWPALRLPLARLTATLEFECGELAEVLVSSPNAKFWNLGESKTPVRQVADYLFYQRVQLPMALRYGGTQQPVLDALKSGDAKFFIDLGWHLENRKRHPKKPPISELKEFLLFRWHPIAAARWPGLAYCTPRARIRFYQITSGDNKAFANPTAAKNFRQICERSGLRAAQIPLVSEISSAGGQLRFH